MKIIKFKNLILSSLLISCCFTSAAFAVRNSISAPSSNSGKSCKSIQITEEQEYHQMCYKYIYAFKEAFYKKIRQENYSHEKAVAYANCFAEEILKGGIDKDAYNYADDFEKNIASANQKLGGHQSSQEIIDPITIFTIYGFYEDEIKQGAFQEKYLMLFKRIFKQEFLKVLKDGESVKTSLIYAYLQAQMQTDEYLNKNRSRY